MKASTISKWSGLGAVAFAASLLMGGSSQPAPTANAIQGVLIDQKCSANAQTRVVSGTDTQLAGGIVWAYTHTKKCALMPDCQRSGYGIATHDDRYLKFDAAGNRKAAEMLRTTKKEDDLEIEVTGQVEGDNIRITSFAWH